MTDVIEFLNKWDLLGFTIAGFISLIVASLFKGLKTLFSMKRRKYCISKSLISATVYQNSEDEGLKITVSYGDKIMDKPVTILKIKLQNDGEEDIFYSQRIQRVHIIIDDPNILNLSAVSDQTDINPRITQINKGLYNLTWDLLKRDEFFYVIIVLIGEVQDLSSIKFDIRADGINQIKRPEYRVIDTMLPALIAALLMTPIILLTPPNVMFIDIISMRLFYIVIIVLMLLSMLVVSLLRRIQWFKEK